MRPAMGFSETIKFVMFKHYADFTGRARRSEYWFFQLFVFLIQFFTELIAYILTMVFSLNSLMIPAAFLTIMILIFFIPSLSLAVRRLHDTGRSGCFIFIALIPLVGVFILLYFFCSDSEDASNDYGPSPKYISNSQDNNSQNLIEQNSPIYQKNP